ncbi:DUF3592 domain-containing protein [Micromonospora sp. NBC_01796]|uniref:DUF3592 domain-containing protein n=1 Tax=Micromonospora sp. NBC_01796 TaxID=2975987 RepID=UPI002DD8C6B5|nr:DUF3592 domain-containing protein [Micromonospora sp. NBC_01796]WSA88293.1 hypothetical protein OIE47_12140 [Micromonospora sp. NBC_01796]
MARRDRRGGGRPRRRLLAPVPDARVADAVPERPLRSRWRPGYWRRHPALSLVLVVLFMAADIAFAASSNANRVSIARDGQAATGTVVSLARRTSGMTVRFTTAAGQTVTASATRPDPEPEVGDSVAIVYHPDDPGRWVYPADGLPGAGTPLALLAIGVVSGLAYLLYLRRTWGRWRDLAESWRHRVPRR